MVPPGHQVWEIFFCVATYDIQTLSATPTSPRPPTRRNSLTTMDSQPASVASSELGLVDLMERLIPQSSPLAGSSLDLRMVGKRNWIKDTSESKMASECSNDHGTRRQGWPETPLVARKFVDDIKAREMCNIEDSSIWISTSKQRWTLAAKQCQAFYDSVVQNARCKGMVVNGAKTQLLCVSAAIHSEVDACIDTVSSNLV